MGQDKLKLAKVIGISLAALAALLLMLFVGYGMGLSGGFYDAERDGYSAQIEHETRDQVDHCLARAQPPASTRECVERAIASSRDSQHGEQDLNAQREMADWAWWLMIITLAQAPLTAVGLVLLLQTIWQGQEANAISRNTGEAQVRAYLSVMESSFQIWEDGRAQLHFTIRNSGNSPALGFMMSFKTGIVSGADLLAADPDFRPNGHPDDGFGVDIPQGETETCSTLLNLNVAEAIQSLPENAVWTLDVVEISKFKDVFGNIIEVERSWLGTGADPGTRLWRVPFNRISMIRIAEEFQKKAEGGADQVAAPGWGRT